MRHISKAQISDIDAIMAIISDAQAMMALQGTGQWQDGTPSRQTILEDIHHHHFFVAKEEDEMIGVMALLDEDADYQTLKTGAWRFAPPYKVIHRFAIKGSYRNQGVGSFLLQSAEQMARENHVYTMRIDTHEGNIPMLRLLEKNGYQAVGTVILEQTKLRTVFEKSLR